MKVTIETREVVDGPYYRHDGKRRMLTHSVVVNDVGALIDVVCGRVRLDGIADAGSMNPGGAQEPPTCPRCLTRFKQRQRLAGKET